MIYYKIKCKYTVTEETDEAKLMRFWRKADSSYVGGQIFRVIIFDRDETTIDAILMFSVSDYSLSSIKKRVISEFDETGETIKSINFSKTPEEITVTEAYSLVEREGLYGDEAINTIVQMMENYRDTVIVIFAGYPDKMERFLEKNEGLRSRIAFHIDFPDYNADELCDILKLMSKNKGFTLDDEAEEKCRRIFDEACKNAEFGNGRFVRNLLEQAIIKQSSRLVKEYGNTKIDKSIVSTLSADDFDINAAKVYKTEKIAIGF